MKNVVIVLLCLLCLNSCKNTKAEKNANEPQHENWIQLFNGKNLDGWVVKIKGHPAGDNFGNTFRVEDGIMKVRYDSVYGATFDDRFGHIFTDKEYSHYKIRVEYRFVGDQMKGAPGWAYRNSGIMLHAQTPESMYVDQDFPASIEAQLLGGNGTDERPTGNVCTPGTDIYIGGIPYKDHCASSTSKTYHGDQWVTIEVVVDGDSIVHHIVEGDTVMTYTHLTVDGKGLNPPANVIAGPLKSGRIALQSEGHPVEFRKVELLDLSGK